MDFIPHRRTIFEDENNWFYGNIRSVITDHSNAVIIGNWISPP